MIEYANESVIKALKQYDMLSKSLKFTTDLKQKQEICYQMTLMIEKVLDKTNKIYEEKYQKIVSRTTYLMDEEKNRLLELINLINERRTYVNNQISNNVEITGINFEANPILGEDKIDEYKSQVKIIEKYKNNIKLDSVLKDELSNLDISIKKANEKITKNRVLNKQLEEKMISLLEKAFTKLSLYELQEREKEIDLAYTELGYALEKAKENAKIARKDCNPEIILECDNLLASTTLEYERYKEKKLILKLIDIYKEPVKEYEELLRKREKINSILSGIVSSELYLEVGNELNKQYATIKLEQQDIATLKSLTEEKIAKSRTLEEINKENESDQFKGILSTLLENEKKYQEQLKQEKKKKEEERKVQQLEEERRKQLERVKRQKALEEERKKEIEERTKQLLVEKKNPILFNNNKEENDRQLKESIKEAVSKTHSKQSQESNLYHTKELIRSKEKLNKSYTPSSTTATKIPSVNSRINRINNVSPKPNDDIFSREIRNNSYKQKEGIPVIKSNKLDNDFVDKNTKTKIEIPNRNLELNKEENIFPTLPKNGENDAFFNDDEFQNLNKFMEDDKKNNWF